MALSTSTSTKPDSPTDDELDRVFHALANRTRRGMLVRLADGPATVSDLAEPFDMTLPGASKHLRVLERAGLTRREVDGRVHRCSLRAEPLEEAHVWLANNERFWEDKLDQLANHIAAQTT